MSEYTGTAKAAGWGWQGPRDVIEWDARVTKCGQVRDGVSIQLPGVQGEFVMDFKGLEELYLAAKKVRTVE